MAMLAILILPLMILGWTAIAVVYPTAVASMANAGPHGFSEVLYAFSSQTANNGSAFGGLTGHILFYNLAGAVSMFIGRFWMIRAGDGDCRIACSEKDGGGLERHLPDHQRAFRRAARRRDPHRRRSHLLPCARARAHRRASRDAGRQRVLERTFGVIPMETIKGCASALPATALLDPAIVVPAIGQAFVKLDPRTLAKNPVMFVLEMVTLLTTVLLTRDIMTRCARHRLRAADRHLACGLPCCSPISPRLWRKGAARRAGRYVCAGRAPRRAPSASCRRDIHELYEVRVGRRTGSGRSRHLRGRRHHPRRRRSDRGHCLGHRGRRHRRVRPGHP